MRFRISRLALLAPAFALLAACGGDGRPDAVTGEVSAVAGAAAQAAVVAVPDPQASAVSPSLSAEDTCAANAQVALDFMNLYLRHLGDQENSATPPDTYDWLKANSLAGPGLASVYATFHDYGADPILDAQDYPDTFVSAGCPVSPDVAVLRGVEMALSVPVKIAQVAGVPKVVGVGAINIEASDWTTATPVASAETCADAWLASYRAEVGEDRVVTMDQMGEWEEWCAQGKSP
ncbi:hypothetical protein [Luteimonas sp. MC1750]|uniref:hypothetical protein n=1 Tax=Luteimonas sp. MC1750 TaxID=2799326 RepID=UPI0018F060E0|nr:hypothetical protein [Luteimonas sp. MC1750]MBJ6984199.1 hypothetical protein [Luteimonas sp. MC1750]QQO07013.1 hypothetical protein JGR68_06245 [Luteimonas sp. MC1750]